MAALLQEPRSKPTRVNGLGVVQPPDILIETPAFSGTLATLFLCVRDQRVELLDIPLLPICEAYIGYLLESGIKDVDEAAAAFAALAYLLERKAWRLLPIAEPEPEEEPAALLDPTIATFETVLELLQGGFEARGELHFRRGGIGLPEPAFDLRGVPIEALARTLERLLERAVPATPEQLQRPRKSLTEQMSLVAARLDTHRRSLTYLVPGVPTRVEIVYTFLAILELIRLGKASVHMEGAEALFSKL